MHKNRRLQEWANSNKPHKNLLYKDAFWEQVAFVQDNVARLLSSSFEEFYDLVDVESTHLSKGINCPVYFIELKNYGIKIWMRYNFYNWNISIDSENPLNCNVLNIFSDEDYGYCFCEGMQSHKFGMYKENNSKFTVCLHNAYEVYTFFAVVCNYLGIQIK